MQNLVADIIKKDLSIYNDSFVEKTIIGRIHETRSKTKSGYIELLSQNSLEREKLKSALNNNFSEFFRNTLTFAFIEHQILPSLLSEKLKENKREIRIWSAACASGQEACSLAILCDEFSRKVNSEVRFRIFATDLSESEINKARKGIYSADALKNVTMSRLKNYFTPKGEKFQVNPGIMEYIDYSVFDLLGKDCICPTASIYGNFDLIFCANLLFYYKTDVQKQIMGKVKHCLSKNGFLAVGETEREIIKSDKSWQSNEYLPVFQKKGMN